MLRKSRFKRGRFGRLLEAVRSVKNSDARRVEFHPEAGPPLAWMVVTY